MSEADETRVAEYFVGRFRESNGCWEWALKPAHAGYGRVGQSSAYRGERLTHRIALTIALNRCLRGNALHRCDNPPCLRPSHLYEGTQADNARDRDTRGRGAAGPRGSRNKLTPDQVQEILQRHAPGRNRWERGNTAELAAEFGIAKKYLSLIVKNGHWSLRDTGARAEKVA